MDSAYMSYCIERSYISADAHELIHVHFAYQFLHSQIFRDEPVFSYLLSGKQAKVPLRIKTAVHPLVFICMTHEIQETVPSGPESFFV